MLGNGYKERLMNAQSSIGSLLLNLPKQQQHEQQEPQLAEDNEPGLDSPFKHSFPTKLVVGSSTNPPTLPPVPAPTLESNSASRTSFQRQQQQQTQPQAQQRTSRLPNATFNLGRLSDQFPELGMPESTANSAMRLGYRASAEDFLIPNGFQLQQQHYQNQIQYNESSSAYGALPGGGSGSARPGPRWDMHSHHGSFYEDNDTSVSNSPRMEEMGYSASLSTKGGNGNNLYPGSGGAGAGVGGGSISILGYQALPTSPSETRISEDGQPALVAVVTIQRAIRRFLVRKQARINKTNISNIRVQGLSINASLLPTSACKASARMIVTTNNKEKLDMESLQETCLRQSEEINQLKGLMTRMLLEVEEDRRRLRQRDREIEELMKQQQQQQKLVQSVNTFPSGFDASITLKNASANVEKQQQQQIVTGNTLGVATDDLYETNMSYSNNVGGPASTIHPLSLPSRSNSITSLQSQSHHHQNHLGLKINPALVSSDSSQSLIYQQQYHGLMDMVDSSSSSELSAQDLVAVTPTTTTTMFGASGGQGLGVGQHGFSSQTSFPLLHHRNSGSFSTSSSTRLFDSPAIEQQGSYPWNNSPVGNLSHSQSWADEVATGYGYESSVSSSSGQFQHGGMAHSATGYDPNFINQQYTHGSQQQQQHQGLPPHRNSYRRHSDKPVHLDYQMCVDRILQATDQQASIHLQQKLKTSPPEQKIQIIDAILGQAFPLMSNRFGNFLIQRCFEFGSPQQIDALAQAMRGNILTLACDPFGCHVVQKALDNVEEDCKARIVTEMFRRIRETIVHRYACHVWQKVFEIRWTDAPPAVMTYVNNAVSGRWASVAVDETGSLVVQNIFENCAEHDKRPVLSEILQSATTIAKGQWGNWVIQHILEHGSAVDRATVTQKILEDAVSLSLDQYASKVVEKTLRMAAMHSSSALPVSSASGVDKSAKNCSNGDDNEKNAGSPPAVIVNGTTIRLTQEEVLNQYIHIVCGGVQDRPRIPLIDIAADQYGNYIVQYILTNAGPQHREACATLIKRHMVSLRGSKYGQKVAFMVDRWRGNPFSGGGGNSGNGAPQGGASYGSKSGSGPDGGNGSGGGNGNGGGRRQRW